MLRPLNLNALLTVQRTVEVDGVSHPMKPITARVAMLCDAATRAEGMERVTLYVDAVCALVPTLTRTQVEDLTIDQIGEVIRHATTEVAAIEDAVGNVASPETTPGVVAT